MTERIIKILNQSCQIISKTSLMVPISCILSQSYVTHLSSLINVLSCSYIYTYLNYIPWFLLPSISVDSWVNHAETLLINLYPGFLISLHDLTCHHSAFGAHLSVCQTNNTTQTQHRHVLFHHLNKYTNAFKNTGANLSCKALRMKRPNY